jgi:hypothetical protein
MRSRRDATHLKKAALGAAFFIAGLLVPGCAAVGPPKASEVQLGPADARTQALFDEAVKLQRRYAQDPKAPVEPFASVLTELSIYHDHERAGYLSDTDTAGTRHGSIDLGPWAQRELALQSMKRGAFVEAAAQYVELGERFAGRSIRDPSDAADAVTVWAGAVALCGQIEAELDSAQAAGLKGGEAALEPTIGLLHETYGGVAAPCDPSCDSYGRKALAYLWRALDQDGAGFDAWLKASRAFALAEASAAEQAEIWVALAEGCDTLGKSSQARDCRAKAMALSADAAERFHTDSFAPKDLLFRNLIHADHGSR